MKKSILNLGEALNKAEQKQINGGRGTCSVRINGSVWNGLSRSNIDNAIKKMDQGDSLQWCCSSCDTASWL